MNNKYEINENDKAITAPIRSTRSGTGQYDPKLADALAESLGCVNVTLQINGKDIYFYFRQGDGEHVKVRFSYDAASTADLLEYCRRGTAAAQKFFSDKLAKLAELETDMKILRDAREQK